MQRRFSLSSITLLDGLAISATVVALAGVVWSPKLTNAVARATGSVKPVEVSVDVRHLQVADSEALLEAIREEGTVSIVIRNQPAGRVGLISVEDISRPLTQLLPNGTVLELKTPARREVCMPASALRPRPKRVHPVSSSVAPNSRSAVPWSSKDGSTA